jgi:hypothetical protein
VCGQIYKKETLFLIHHAILAVTADPSRFIR